MADEISSGVKLFPGHEGYPEHGDAPPLAPDLAARQAERAAAAQAANATAAAAKAAEAAKAPPAPVVVSASVKAPALTPVVIATPRPQSKSTPPNLFPMGPAPKQSA